jgi:hypothetical protein
VRSRLVHGNVSELDVNQEYFFDWGQKVLEFSIFREMKHLPKKTSGED